MKQKQIGKVEGKKAKVHSFLKQCFARFSIDTIWWYLQLMSAGLSLKTSGSYHQIESIERCEKHFFKKLMHFSKRKGG
jgi:hypothetical protein